MHSESRSRIKKEDHGHVSVLHKRSTEHSTHLCIFNVVHKLQHSGIYDIGGTYLNDKPHLRFYVQTSACHGENYLLNLFVMSRQPLKFTIMLPKYNVLPELINANEAKAEIAIEVTHDEYSFHPKVEDENIFLKTFLFTQRDIDSYEGVNLLLPIKLSVNHQFILNNDVVRSIQNAYNTTGLLTRDNNTDYILESVTRKKFPVHKVILAASSPVLRNLIRTNKELLVLQVDSATIEILLEFLYTGSVVNIMHQDNLEMLELAEKFQLEKLSMWIQDIVCKQISINNVVDIALSAKKYRLSKMREAAFAYIKKHPEVLNTKAWGKIDDVELLKSLLSFIHGPDKNAADELSLTVESNLYVTFSPRFG